MTITFDAVDPRTGETAGSYEEATPAEVDATVRAAAQAARSEALGDRDRRAAALRGAAARLRAREAGLVQIVGEETGLPPGRVQGELARTCGQLEAFAAVVEEGSYVEAILDTPDPAAQPVPRPDVRRMLVPLGPIAVFGASNFPLAFSTAGGDTASALAAGCPVVVKGHPLHPGTGSLVAGELTAAVVEAGLPEGTFAHLLAAGHAVGEALVDHPATAAVAFTGSLRGGRALMDRAAARPQPIPVFAEMGSLNPVVLTEAALAARADAIRAALTRSVADFGGQLCTKPGLVLVPEGDAGDAFARALAAALAERGPETLLSRGVLDGLRSDRGELDAGAERLTPADGDRHGGGFHARPSVHRAPAADLERVPALTQEHFGPAVIVLSYASLAEAADALERAGGQLTATVHAEPSEQPALAPLVEACTRVAGRVIFDGVPTGVAVTYGMQHGGPFPASSSPGFTSVGMTALRRFLRPVAWQDAPQALLPPALRDGNPLGIWRRIDGEPRRD